MLELNKQFKDFKTNDINKEIENFTPIINNIIDDIAFREYQIIKKSFVLESINKNNLQVESKKLNDYSLEEHYEFIEEPKLDKGPSLVKRRKI